MGNQKIALLRGINVGGHRKILMADLKELLKNIGLTNIITYIQSGNVIFNTMLSSEEVSEKIQLAIKEQYEFDVPVIILERNELLKVVSNNPYANIENYNPKQLYMTFLKSKPSQNKIDELSRISFLPDLFKINDKSIHLYFNGKSYLSKLTNKLIEKQLETVATTRNLNTCNKLIKLSES